MGTNFKAGLAIVAVFAVAGTLWLQQREISRLRETISEHASAHAIRPAESPSGRGAAVSTPPADELEKLRNEAAEVHSLRAEVNRLRSEEVDFKRLEAAVDKLAGQVGVMANRGNVVRVQSEGIIAGGSTAGRGPSTISPVVSQATSLARSSPVDAAKWVASLPPGEDQNRAAMAVLSQWISTDPVAAAGWTAQFAEGPLREQALWQVAREWGLRNWNDTSSWLAQLPPGPSRDSAIDAFVTSADGYDIKLALEWANRMENQEKRALRVESTAQRWLGENPTAARTWIQQAQLPSGMAQRLLSAK